MGLGAPLLEMVSEIINELEGGRSLRIAIQQAKVSSRSSMEMLIFLAKSQEPGGLRNFYESLSSERRRLFYFYLEKGLKGEPLLESLREFEKELLWEMETKMEEHLASLPYKLLIPLLFFQFPAFIILMLGPILKQFLESLS